MRTIKYSMTILVGMFIIIGNAFALTLAVTSPNGGETWIIGHTHPITWNYSGPERQLKLELLKGGQVWTIVENIPARQQVFQWKVGEYIGGKALGGTGYMIRAKMMSSTDTDSSNGPFTLMSLLPQPLQEKKPTVELKKKPLEMERQYKTPAMQLLPDLLIKQGSFEKQLMGDSYNLRILIANQGAGDAGPNLVCVQSEAKIEILGVPVASACKHISELKAKTERWEYIMFFDPKGARDFEIIVDREHHIRETNEWNNVFKLTTF